MQGQRSIFDLFPETVDLNQVPNLNSRGMNEPDEYNNMLSPTQRQLSNDHNSRSFSSWDIGESSSRANVQEQVANDGSKVEHNWPSTFVTHDSRFKESSNTHLCESFSGSQVGVGPSNMQHSGSNHSPMDVDLNVRYGGNSSDDGGHGMRFMNLYKLGSPETEASASSSGIGTNSESQTGSSFGSWGQSCERKALEGTSRQFFASGSSNCSPEAENIMSHTLPVRYSGSSNGSSSLQSSRWISHSDYMDQTSRGPISISTNSSHPSNPQPHLVDVPVVPRNVAPFPLSGNNNYNNNINSRNGSSSSSALTLERGSRQNFRSTLRNNEQNRYFIPSNETRNLVQDPNNWSLATERASINGGNATSSSRNSTGSRSHPSNAVWTPYLTPPTQSQQRLSGFPPWALFPSSEAESGRQRGHFPPFPTRSPTSEENVISSGLDNQEYHHQPFLRSASLMEVPGDERHAFAADIEGRHRLVSEMRHILIAMRRGENLQPEDYTVFDPFINGVAELHDRHRDMRLDVDNMSYEELLALEERIGDVKTGLSEEVILKSMKQRKHISFMAILNPYSEPCCICREEYDTGDDIGILDCGHDFHTYCIKQWLTQKNLCPICKLPGLST